MLNSLYSKLLVVFFGFGAMMTMICLVVLNVSHEKYHAEFAQRFNRSLATALANQHFLEAPPSGQSGLAGLLARFKLVNPNVDLYLVTRSGQVLAASVPLERVRRKTIDAKPLLRFIEGDSNFPFFGEDPLDDQRKEVFSAAPVTLAGHPDSLLYIVLHRQAHAEGAQALRSTYALQEGTLFTMAGATFAILASIWIIKILTSRLRVLAGAMEEFRRNGFATLPQSAAYLRKQASDEIGELTHIFAAMAERIVAQLKSLRRNDDMRREMLANISHDLRTPLTSLQAHLDTLAMGGPSLSAEERSEYLSIAVKQARRMAKLVETLLDLARLEGGQVTPKLEPFLVADLVQDVAQKFELAATNKGIRVHCDVRQQAPLVLADVGLLERVLDNLLDNALRHTPSGGTVTVRLIPRGNLVTLEVSDTGTGIDRDALPRIFDRFYRGDKSRPTATSSAGLGLAIVKSILNLHQTSIEVESAPGKGTTFSFALPVVARAEAAPEPVRQG